MSDCQYRNYCKESNEKRDNFICFNPIYCLENVCEIFKPSHNNHKVELFRPDQEMIKEAMKERKRRRRKKN